MKPELLLAWWNLLYIAPFFVALLYLVLYCVSGLTFGDDLAVEGQDVEHDVDADADADLDHDVELDAGADLDHDVNVDASADLAHVDVDHDVSVDHDVGVDHDVDADHDADVETPLDTAAHAGQAVDYDAHATPVDHASQVSQQPSHDHSQPKPEGRLLFRALSWLGIGRVPLSILLMVLCLSWGFIGFAANNLLISLPVFSVAPAFMTFVSFPVAMTGSVILTRSTARVLGKWMPTTETYAQPRRALVGSVGEALYPIDQKFGMAVLHDVRGNLHQVSCRVYEDAKPLNKGSRVLLVDYNETENYYWVIESDL